jgi:6-phosphogluconate dehydrogenase
MQLIAEAYDFLKRGLGMEAAEMSRLFEGWNRTTLDSFLMEITAKILGVRDPESGEPLVELVEDRAGQKGTGRWTVQTALELGVAVPTIAAAVDARIVSSMKEERLEAESRISGPTVGQVRAPGEGLVRSVHDALLASTLCSFAQGMSMIRAASEECKWGIDLGEIARIWKGGCIIRARLLDPIRAAYERRPALPSLLLDEELGGVAETAQAGWRGAVATAASIGLPMPATAASLAWFDGYRTSRLPQNLTQAQRDAFGSHTYERTDQPERGKIHTDWLGED